MSNNIIIFTYKTENWNENFSNYYYKWLCVTQKCSIAINILMGYLIYKEH